MKNNSDQLRSQSPVLSSEAVRNMQVLMSPRSSRTSQQNNNSRPVTPVQWPERALFLPSLCRTLSSDYIESGIKWG
ncbi:uncharacterized protein LOC141528052 isoform X2 [Cotesia typhae]|uniref:uncharacterized protein LOC141528052 isoform X2 n=1 Tax=Cotesia typhae TaxID=2053667 RepID=UPI003D685634